MDVQKDPERSEARYLRQYADVAGKRILEIGSGEGRLTWTYADSARGVIGIDLDRDALRVATIERASDLKDRVEFAQADSVRLPFAAGAYELAILAWSF
jgi:ubiquinone/menaquinone biosynthesis C-methylase UbiE